MKQDSACIFIDGENLRFALCKLFSDRFNRNDYLPNHADWEGLFAALTTLSKTPHRLRTYWYTVEHIDFFPYGLNQLKSNPTRCLEVLRKDNAFRVRYNKAHTAPEKSAIIEQALADLTLEEQKMRNRFEGWKTFQDGIAQRFESLEFRRAGSIHYNLFDRSFGKEKAVDVKLATDLLELRNIYQTAIIVSGDQDYVPAVQAIKNSGKEVVNVSFLKQNGELLPGGARRLNLATDRKIELPYAQLLGFMRFPVLATPLNLNLPPA
jgi:uncharacterized LabA/DUF88 family protein